MELKPLQRQTVQAPQGQAPVQPLHEAIVETIAPEKVSRLAQDAFISRSYELKNSANMGQGLDGATRAMAAVASDIEGLTRADLTVGTGLALTGKLIRDGASVAVNTGRFVDGFRRAHVGLARTTGGHQAAATAMGSTVFKATERFQPLLTRVERVGAVGSLGLAVVSLPALATSAVKRNGAAITAITDAKTTKRQKIEAIKDASYTNAALAYTAVAVPSAIKTLAATGHAKSSLTRLAKSAQGTAAYQQGTRVTGVMTPVADATLLVADGLHLYTTMTSPSATGKAKARAALNVSLDALKLGLYAFPRTRGVHIAYTAAGITQLGFAVHSIVRPDQR